MWTKEEEGSLLL